MIIAKSFSTLLAIVILSASLACLSAAAQENSQTLQKQMPPPAEFIIPDGLDDDEKKWYLKFQKGNFMVDGWQDISASILQNTPESLKKDQQRLLQNLGVKIGTEWCRDNSVRRVDTSKLKEWGKNIKQTAKEDPESLHSLLVSINKEVDSLLD